eukprot:4772029-Amphidinium_carterae.2
METTTQAAALSTIVGSPCPLLYGPDFEGPAPLPPQPPSRVMVSRTPSPTPVTRTFEVPTTSAWPAGATLSHERHRRCHLPQNLHEGSSDDSVRDSETLMMGGNVVAQLNQTSTMDDIPFKRNGQGFVVLPLQLTKCRQRLLCARHFPYPTNTGSAEGLDVFDDTYRHHRMTVKEVNEQYAATYYPMSRSQATLIEVQLVGRCCACSREEDLTRCMNKFCLHLACPDHVWRLYDNHIVCFCCDQYNRADEAHLYSPREIARTVPAPRGITDRWLLEHELKWIVNPLEDAITVDDIMWSSLGAFVAIPSDFNVTGTPHAYGESPFAGICFTCNMRSTSCDRVILKGLIHLVLDFAQ